jgi:hypothetical protein
MYTITHVFVLNRIVTVLENYCVVKFFCQKLGGPWPTLANRKLGRCHWWLVVGGVWTMECCIGGDRYSRYRR